MAVHSTIGFLIFLYTCRKISIFYIYCEYLITKRALLFLIFAPFASLLLLLLSNHYFGNFVRFNFGRIYMIVETNLTHCFCTANFKGHYLPPLRSRFKNNARQLGQLSTPLPRPQFAFILFLYFILVQSIIFVLEMICYASYRLKAATLFLQEKDN